MSDHKKITSQQRAAAMKEAANGKRQPVKPIGKPPELPKVERKKFRFPDLTTISAVYSASTQKWLVELRPPVGDPITVECPGIHQAFQKIGRMWQKAQEEKK